MVVLDALVDSRMEKGIAPDEDAQQNDEYTQKQHRGFQCGKEPAIQISLPGENHSNRGQGIAGRLLDQAVEDLRTKSISPVYLLTDHTGFYERYGWEFLCMAQGDGESYLSRTYVHY